MIEHVPPVSARPRPDAALMDEVRHLLAAELGLAPDQLTDDEVGAYLEQALADTDSDAPAPSIQSLFEAQATRTPDAVAVEAAGRRLTYRELNARANQVAHYLRQFGVGPDVLVSIYQERSLAMVVGLLGILKAGGAYVPLDPSYPPERTAFVLQDAAVAVLLTQQRLADTLPAHAARTICLDTDWPAIATESRANPEAPTAAAHLAYLIYTSGSTSKPKGVMVTHASVVHYVGAMREAVGITADDIYLHTASFAFSSSVRQLLTPLCHGACAVIATAEQIRNPIALFELVKERGVTVMDLIPSYWRNGLFALSHLDASARAVALDNRVRLILSASEPLLSDIPGRWTREFDHPATLINMFGQTETTGIVAVYPIPRPPAEQVSVVAIGRPIARTQIYLLDAHLQLVPPGIAGEVYIGGAGLARGYLNQPALTAERFIPDPFTGTPGARLYRTGDLARHRGDGVLEFLGRADHQVKIRGVRIELGEIEGALRQHAAVRDAVVVAREDTPGDKRLVAYVVPSDGQAERRGAARAENQRPSPDLRHALRDHLRQTLPSYMAPSAFVVLAAMPTMPNGKINRHALPAPDQTRPESERAFVAPRTAAEERLARIWAEVLRLDRVGVDDHFFELGGDSILAIQVIARANQARLPVTPRQLFQYTTVADLARVAGAAPAVQAEQGLITGPAPLAPSQAWFFDLDLPNPHHFNQAFMFEVRQPLDPAVVEQAVHHLLLHHDALRLRFRRADAGWRQSHGDADGPSPFSWIDLAMLPAAEQGPAIEAAATALQTSLDLEHGPLIRVALFHLGADRASRLLITVHHLAMDGVSRRIVLEDLYTACRQLSSGQPVQLPPKTTAFRHWTERLTEYARSADLRAELDEWLAEPRRRPAPLPVDFADGVYSLASSDIVSTVLSVEETRALLQEAPRTHHTQINDVLLAATLHTCARWTGAPALLIDLVGHAREPVFDEVDLSRTVGWCSATCPVLLEHEPGATPLATLRAVHEQLRRLPNHGLGYGVLRYLSDDPAVAGALRTMPQPEIVFSYAGQFDQTLADSPLFAVARESIGPAQDPRGRWPYRLDIYAHVVGGQLTVNWLYSANLYHRSTIDGLAAGFVEALRAIRP